VGSLEVGCHFCSQPLTPLTLHHLQLDDMHPSPHPPTPNPLSPSPPPTSSRPLQPPLRAHLDLLGRGDDAGDVFLCALRIRARRGDALPALHGRGRRGRAAAHPTPLRRDGGCRAPPHRRRRARRPPRLADDVCGGPRCARGPRRAAAGLRRAECACTPCGREGGALLLDAPRGDRRPAPHGAGRGGRAARRPRALRRRGRDRSGGGGGGGGGRAAESDGADVCRGPRALAPRRRPPAPRAARGSRSSGGSGGGGSGAACAGRGGQGRRIGRGWTVREGGGRDRARPRCGGHGGAAALLRAEHRRRRVSAAAARDSGRRRCARRAAEPPAHRVRAAARRDAGEPDGCAPPDGRRRRRARPRRQVSLGAE
jgi:hypothetical protein